MANHFPVLLREVDRIEVITVIDNYVDVLLVSTANITRPPNSRGEEIPTDALLAEHGLCLLVNVYQGEETHTILFDTGYTRIGVLHNMELLEIVPDAIETIVLSHGHMDHTGSLYPLIKKISNPIQLMVHPDAFLFPRYVEAPDGKRLRMPRTLIRDDLAHTTVKLFETKSPTLMANDMIMVTGEVERITKFEKGMPNAFVEINGKNEPDRILDDQSLVINLKGKGLVVIAGCSHAGIINTVFFSEKITGVSKIHAILGGFHLSGPAYEQIIEETIQEFKKIAPEIIVPMHCTGWNAIHRFSQEFPSSFRLNSVGTKITLS